jgi:hypothetical protein
MHRHKLGLPQPSSSPLLGNGINFNDVSIERDIKCLHSLQGATWPRPTVAADDNLLTSTR